MPNKIGICKFCGQNKKFAKAHIIPQSFYKGKCGIVNEHGRATLPSMNLLKRLYPRIIRNVNSLTEQKKIKRKKAKGSPYGSNGVATDIFWKKATLLKVADLMVIPTGFEPVTH